MKEPLEKILEYLVARSDNEFKTDDLASILGLPVETVSEELLALNREYNLLKIESDTDTLLGNRWDVSGTLAEFSDALGMQVEAVEWEVY